MPLIRLQKTRQAYCEHIFDKIGYGDFITVIRCSKCDIGYFSLEHLQQLTEPQAQTSKDPYQADE